MLASYILAKTQVNAENRVMDGTRFTFGDIIMSTELFISLHLSLSAITVFLGGACWVLGSRARTQWR